MPEVWGFVLVWFVLSFVYWYLFLFWGFFFCLEYASSYSLWVHHEEKSGWTQGRKLEVENEAQAMKECRLPI